MTTTEIQAPEDQIQEVEIHSGDVGVFKENRWPWGGIGELDAPLLSMEQLWTASPKMASDVKLVPIQTADGVEIPRKYATVREYDNTPLGVVGDRFRVFQNKETTQLGSDIIDQSGASIENALLTHGGARFAVIFRIPEEFTIGGIDTETYYRYLTLTNSHDGSSPLQAFTGLVRGVCRNTIAMAVNQAVNMYRIRHTQSLQGRIQEIRAALQFSIKYQEEIQKLGEELLAQKMTKPNWDKFLKSLCPVPIEDEASKRAVTMAQGRFDAINDVYWQTDDLSNIRGTKWGALQAVIEYHDHQAPRRETKSSTADENRFTSIWQPTGDHLPTRALALLTA